MNSSHRSRVLGAAVLGVAWCISVVLGAAPDDEVRVPIALQAALLSKVARYDQNLAARAGETLRILVLHPRDDARSRALAGQAKEALDAVTVLPKTAQSVELAEFDSPAAVATRCSSEHVAVLVLSTGFRSVEIRALAEALAGADVLTTSLAAQDVETGAVLGFDAISGKPKILVNLRQAQRQNVRLAASLLALAKVVP